MGSSRQVLPLASVHRRAKLSQSAGENFSRALASFASLRAGPGFRISWFRILGATLGCGVGLDFRFRVGMDDRNGGGCDFRSRDGV